MIKAELLMDSVNPSGSRLTTWILTYPRFIHAEIMTHRMFSRNAASSRAIPMAKMRKQAEEEPACFEQWTENRKGMSGSASEVSEQAEALWLKGRDNAAEVHRKLEFLKCHKQNANRILEPWLHMTGIFSMTQLGNFFSQRCGPNAMPEFQVLAFRMLDLYLKSTPAYRIAGEWHVPFARNVPEGSGTGTALKISTARAARVSYVAFDKEFSANEDIDLHDRLCNDGHWSPFEHCARAMADDGWSGNFRGWVQYRKQFANESVDSPDLEQLMAAKPEWVTL